MLLFMPPNEWKHALERDDHLPITPQNKDMLMNRTHLEKVNQSEKKNKKKNHKKQTQHDIFMTDYN